MENESNDEKEIIKPSNSMMSFILRQEMNSYTPNCNVRCAVIFNLFLMALFAACGIPIIILSNSINEYSVDYTSCTASVCKVSISIDQDLTKPVFLYYSLSKFFLNQRDLARSRSFPQLRNKADSGNYTKCEGAKLVQEMFDFNTTRYKTFWNQTLDPLSIANPCGLQAKSFFNDAFSLTDSSNKTVAINETSISNSYYNPTVFARDSNYTYTQWLDVEDEHFIIWMQMETFSDFRKLWGRIPNGLSKGTYTFTINNSKLLILILGFNIASYGGKKLLILSTTSALGREQIIGWINIGGIGLAFMILISIAIAYAKGYTLYDKMENFENIKW